MNYEKKLFLIIPMVFLLVLIVSCGNSNNNINLDTQKLIMFDGDNFTFQIPLPIRYESTHIIIPQDIPQPPRINNINGQCSSIDVEWQEEPNAERYFIKYRDESGYETTFDPEDLDPYFTYGEIMDITIPDLVEGESYDVCVMAWNTDGMSGCNDGSPTDEYGWQFGIEALGLGIPSGLALSSDGETINMVWSRVACADDGYEIEIDNDGYITYETEAQVSEGYTHVSHSFAAIGGETYSIKVRSLRGSEVSDWGPAEIIAPEGPELSVTPLELHVVCETGSSVPPENVRVTNEGGGTLHWHQDEGVANPDQLRLELQPDSGYLPSGEYEITQLGIDCSKPAGEYQGIVRVEDDDSGNYLDVNVYVTVTEEFQISPASVNISCGAPQMYTEHVDLSIMGSMMDWTASENTNWLWLNQYSGQSPSTVRVNVDCYQRAGDHDAVITFEGPEFQTVEVPVHVEVRFPGDPNTFYPDPAYGGIDGYIMAGNGSGYSADSTDRELRVFRTEEVEWEENPGGSGGAYFPVDIRDYRSFISFYLTPDDVANMAAAKIFFYYHGNCDFADKIMAVERIEGSYSDVPRCFDEGFLEGLFNETNTTPIIEIILDQGLNSGSEYIDITDLVTTGFNSFRISITNWTWHTGDYECDIRIASSEDQYVDYQPRLDIFE